MDQTLAEAAKADLKAKLAAMGAEGRAALASLEGPPSDLAELTQAVRDLVQELRLLRMSAA